MHYPDLLALHINFFESALDVTHLENPQQREYFRKLPLLPRHYQAQPSMQQVKDLAGPSLRPLLEGLLVMDPRKRLSAMEALKILGSSGTKYEVAAIKVDTSLVKTSRNMDECHASILREGQGIIETLPSKPRAVKPVVEPKAVPKALLIR